MGLAPHNPEPFVRARAPNPEDSCGRVETLGAFRGTGLVDLCFFWGFRTPQAAARKTGTPSGKKVSPQTTGTIDQFVKSTAVAQDGSDTRVHRASAAGV